MTPSRMGTRLRELRAVHAAEARRELRDEIAHEMVCRTPPPQPPPQPQTNNPNSNPNPNPNQTRARIAYTDYTEEDERLRLERKQADAEAELVWKIDRSFQGLNEG